MNTPQQEVDSLLEKFRPFANVGTSIWAGGIEPVNENVKQLAILHVQGIIEAINDAMLYKQSKRDFWKEVLNILQSNRFQ